MKLATLKDGSRDGQLIVVSRDLKTAVIADSVASHLQRVLDDWPFYAPQLDALYDALNHGRARRVFAFAPENCMAPLPRAYQWLDVENANSGEDCEANPVALRWRDGAAPRASTAALELTGPARYAPGLAMVVGEIAPGQAASQMLLQIRLTMLALTVQDECAARVPRQRRTTIFSPVAITSDEFGAGWQDGRIELPFAVRHNARRVDVWDRTASVDLGACLALATREQSLIDGALISSSLHPTLPALASVYDETYVLMRQRDHGSQTSLAPDTLPADRLAVGDSLRLDMFDAKGHSLCGVIEANLHHPPMRMREGAELDKRACQSEIERQQNG